MTEENGIKEWCKSHPAEILALIASILALSVNSLEILITLFYQNQMTVSSMTGRGRMAVLGYYSLAYVSTILFVMLTVFSITLICIKIFKEKRRKP